VIINFLTKLIIYIYIGQKFFILTKGIFTVDEPDFKKEILGGSAITLMYSGERLPAGYALTEVRQSNYSLAPQLLEIAHLHTYGAKEFYAPKPVHSRQISNKEVLRRDTSDICGIRFYGLNMEADGVLDLKGGDAYIIANAGCFLVAIQSGETICVIHASRLNLFHEINFLKGYGSEVPSGFSSITAAAMYAMDRKDVLQNRKQRRVWIGFGARPNTNTYPPSNEKFGYQNRKRLEHIISRLGSDCVIDFDAGIIDFAKVIRKKLELQRIPGENIEVEDSSWMPQVGASEKSNQPRNLCAIIVK
jgi:hypothetical protein